MKTLSLYYESDYSSQCIQKEKNNIIHDCKTPKGCRTLETKHKNMHSGSPYIFHFLKRWVITWSKIHNCRFILFFILLYWSFLLNMFEWHKAGIKKEKNPNNSLELGNWMYPLMLTVQNLPNSFIDFFSQKPISLVFSVIRSILND